MEPTVVADAPNENMAVLYQLGENVVYLMGFSFILGSLFTILILVMLDFMRRRQQPTAR